MLVSTRNTHYLWIDVSVNLHRLSRLSVFSSMGAHDLSPYLYHCADRRQSWINKRHSRTEVPSLRMQQRSMDAAVWSVNVVEDNAVAMQVEMMMNHGNI